MQTISVVGWLPQTTNRKPQFAELGKEWLTQEVLLWMYVFLAISYCYYRSFGRLRALEVLSAPAPTLGSNFPVISLKSFVKCSKRSKEKSRIRLQIKKLVFGLHRHRKTGWTGGEQQIIENEDTVSLLLSLSVSSSV